MMNEEAVNPLHLLATCGTDKSCIKIRNMLESARYRVSEIDTHGLTPLHLAAAYDNVNICRLLLYFGANPLQKDIFNRAPKDVAVGSSKSLLNEHIKLNRPFESKFLDVLRRIFLCGFHVTHPDSLDQHLQSTINEDAGKPKKNYKIYESERNGSVSSYATALSKFTDLSSLFVVRGNQPRSGNKLAPQTITYVNNNDDLDQLNDSMAEFFTDDNESEIVPEHIQRLTNYQLRREFTMRKINIGPLIPQTRRVYEKKLHRLMRFGMKPKAKKKCYSWILEQMMRGQVYDAGEIMDGKVRNYFAHYKDEKRNERTAFCYILIDPSLVNDSSKASLKEFVDSIFYIGKGKRSRPLQHLVEALKSDGDSWSKISAKVHQIRELWKVGFGIVVLHVFQNISHREAYLREAAMIDAIGISNLTNEKRGQYYDIDERWNSRHKLIYGSYLLQKALEIFHVEGCRQLYEHSLDQYR